MISGSTGESEYKYGVRVYMANSIDDYGKAGAVKINLEQRHSFGATDDLLCDGELELGKASPKSLLRGIPINFQGNELEGLPENLASFVFPHVPQTAGEIMRHLDNGVAASNGSRTVPVLLQYGGTTTVNPVGQQIYTDYVNQQISGVTPISNGQQINVPETTYMEYKASVLEMALAANRALAGGILIELVPWTEAKLPHFTRKDPHIPTLTVDVQLTNFRIYAPNPAQQFPTRTQPVYYTG